MRRAKGLGRIVRGAFITRGASSEDDGSGVPSCGPKSLLVLALALFATLAFAASASASKQALNYFGTASGSGSLGGDFNDPRGIAVNTTGEGPANQGDVYVVDSSNNRIERFSSAGEFISAWGADVVQAGGSGDLGDETAKDFEICTVASECKEGVASAGNGATSGNGSLSSPQSVAVDGDTGNVYISDRANKRINEYAGDGAFIRSFGWGVDETEAATEYEVCPAANACGVGAEGEGAGQIGATFFSGTLGLAVSPPDGNPTSGALFLADSHNRRVNTYALDGTSPSSFGSSAVFGEDQPRQLAVDSRGIVYASDSSSAGVIQRYDTQDADGGGVGFLAPILPPLNEQQEINFTGFQVGDTFTLTCPGGSTTAEIPYSTGSSGGSGTNGPAIILKALEEECAAPGNFAASGDALHTTVTFQGDFVATNEPQMTCTRVQGSGSCSVTTTTEGRSGPLLPNGNGAETATAGLAVDPDSDGGGPDSDVLYVLRSLGFSHNSVVQQFGPNHAPGQTAAPTAADDTHGAGAGLEFVQGLGLDSQSGHLLISSGRRVFILGDTPLPDPVQSIDPVTTHTATIASFTGTVDPNGLNGLSCEFQYSEDGISWTGVPVPECGSLPAFGGSQAVSVEAAELASGQLYHARLLVTKPLGTGTAVSSETTFTTEIGPPVISKSAVDWLSIGNNSAEVEAKVNPENQDTSYHVEYVTKADFDVSGFAGAGLSSTPDIGIGNGNAPVGVSVQLKGLQPGTPYRARFVATNPSGTGTGSTLAFVTYAANPVTQSCPNAEFRTGQSANLPDCRAYEQASSTNKDGGSVNGSPKGSTSVSPSGDAVVYFSQTGNIHHSEGGQQFSYFLSRRQGGAWSTSGILPPQDLGSLGSSGDWLNDLSGSFAETIDLNDFSFSFYYRSGTTGTVTKIFPETCERCNIAGDSADGSKILFSTREVVTPEALAGRENLYVWDRDTGQSTYAGILPDSACATPPCVAAEGAYAGPYNWWTPSSFAKSGAEARFFVQDMHPVTESGDVYFTDEAAKQIYLRMDPTEPDDAETVKVSASRRSTPDPNGTKPAAFMWATPSGSKAFFTSAEELTDDANTGATAKGKDLYAWQPNGAGSCAEVDGCLTDLTPDSSAGDVNGAEVLGVLGISNDGESVAFVANGDLDGSGLANPGDCARSGTVLDDYDYTGACSLYLLHDGETTLVARLDTDKGNNRTRGRDASNWQPLWAGEGQPMGRLSADGETVLFSSQSSLTGYDNNGPSCVADSNGFYHSGPCAELYRYNVDDGLTCVSCNPTGASPLAPATVRNVDDQVSPIHSSRPRILSADGNQVFFESPDKLVTTDVNGDQGCPEFKQNHGSAPSCQDVYEWVAEGTGSCQSGVAGGGCLYLLSTGTGTESASLVDVSASGSDAFILNVARLVPTDQDELVDVYDLSIGGGLASQHPNQAPPCEGDACRGASSIAPAQLGAGTASFAGPGNPKPKHAKSRHRKAHKHEKQRKRHHKRADERANSNRGGQK
jgi:hypothetical protein